MEKHQVKMLPEKMNYLAPDGSEVRLLLEFDAGGMAHFRLPPGKTSQAVRHKTVVEIWYFVKGRGEMWLKDRGDEEGTVHEVKEGMALSIPVGTTFQFRTFDDAPLEAVAATMPKWPGEDEAVFVDGTWTPTVREE